MHTLFNEPSGIQYGKFLTPRSEKSAQIARENMQAATQYYRTRKQVVHAGNILLRLLTITPFPKPGLILSHLSIDVVEKYYNEIKNRSRQYSNAVSMSTPNNTGRLQSGNFYNKKITEVILHKESVWDEDNYFAWEDIEAVKVLRHPYNTPGYNLLNGEDNDVGAGVAVITIDVALLALQFLRWYESEYFDTDVTKAKITLDMLKAFCSKYPLVNALKSHNDIAIINRAIDHYESDGKFEDLTFKRPVFTINMDEITKLDLVLDYLTPELKRTPRYFEDILNHLPTVYRNGQDVIALDNELDHRQTRWAKLTARMWVINFLLEVNNHFKGRNKNGIAVNKIARSVKSIMSDNLFNNITADKTFKLFINSEYDSIKTQLP